jgi:hypothetical protein
MCSGRDSNLCEDNGDDGLGVHKGGVAEVVQATGLEDLCTGLEPDSLAELDAAVLGEELGGEAAQSAEHGPPGVDHLDLTVPGCPEIISITIGVYIQCSQCALTHATRVIDAVACTGGRPRLPVPQFHETMFVLVYAK